MKKKTKHIKLGRVLCRTEKGGYFMGDLIDNYGDGTSFFVYNRDWITKKQDESEIKQMWMLNLVTGDDILSRL